MTLMIHAPQASPYLAALQRWRCLAFDWPERRVAVIPRALNGWGLIVQVPMRARGADVADAMTRQYLDGPSPLPPARSIALHRTICEALHLRPWDVTQQQAEWLTLGPELSPS